MNQDFVALLRELREAEARFLVVGAYALAHHARPRATGDLDIWVESTPENARRVHGALHAFGAPLTDLSVADLTQPDHIFWCDGSDREREHLTAEAVRGGVLTQLDQKRWPGSYYHRSNPNDVARVEQCTFICTPTRDEAGPTNNWMQPDEMYQIGRAHV